MVQGRKVILFLGIGAKSFLATDCTSQTALGIGGLHLLLHPLAANMSHPPIGIDGLVQ